MTAPSHRCSRSRSTVVPTNLGPVLPAKLSFHPSHHPRDFLSVPEWSYGRSKRLSLTRIKLSLPPIKALRVAPKPPAKKEKRLTLEDTAAAPQAESASESGEVSKVEASDKDDLALQTTAVEAMHLLKKMRETKGPSNACTGPNNKADALDEEFSEDPFLDSLRCVFMFPPMLPRSLTRSPRQMALHKPRPTLAFGMYRRR